MSRAAGMPPVVCLGVVMWLTGSGCGNSKAEASVAACESWLAGMSCGDIDYRGEFDCQIYGEERCDVSPYFYCLEQNTVCDAETSTFDLTGWEKCQVAADCAD